MGQWYFNPIGESWLLVAAALIVLLAAFFAGGTSARAKPRQRRVLIGLRVAIFLAILLAMLRPTHVFTESKKQSATLIVLLDRSRSMLVPDAFSASPQTRWDALRDALNDALPQLEDLAEDLEVKIYAFDSDVKPIDFSEGDIDLGEANGTQTAIGASLEDILRREAGKRLAGVILLSDGAHQAYAPRDLPPETAVRRLADLGYPLYTFVFGQALTVGQARDAALKDLNVSSTVFVKNQLPIEAVATLRGLVNLDVPVQVLLESEGGKMEVVDTKTLTPLKDGEQIPLDIPIVPQVPGERKLTLRVPPQERELVTSNNELSTFVTVLKGGLNVLYLEGDPRFEQVFLSKSLGLSPDIKIDRRNHNHLSSAQWPLDFAEDFKSGKYDVYIIGDLDSRVFKQEDLEALSSTVKAGAGLIMLGGLQSYWGGGYQDTPLVDVLPVKPDQFQKDVRQEFDAPIRKDLHTDADVRMVPGRRFGDISIMMLATKNQNRDAWLKLPPLDGANRFFQQNLKPTAKVIGESEGGEPLLVADEFGTGRVLAFAGDSTWHWWMQGFQAEHKRFWRQVVLWLARKDESTDGNVWVRLDQRRFTPGRRVELTAGAQSALGEPVADAQFQAEVVLPDGKRQPLRLSRQGEDMSGSFLETTQTGDYTVVVTATRAGENLGTARSRFLVYEHDLELDNAAARPALLAHLAKMTEGSGGKALAAEQLPSLLEELKNQPPELEVQTETKQTPWDSPPFFVLVVALLSVEWYLRKKWGMV